MKKRDIFFTSIVLMLILIVKSYAFDNVSYRLKGMGTELNWIIDDEYTDIFQNPASINVLSQNWLLTNFSNLNSGGSILLGGFYKLKNWNVGLIADYLSVRNWSTYPYNASITRYSYPYPYESEIVRQERRKDGKNPVGVWQTDYDNDTPDPDDDYRVIEERDGLKINEYGNDLNLSIVLGRKNFGLSYHLKNSVFEDPPILKNGFNRRTLIELGNNAAKEAFSSVQEEINECKNETIEHNLIVGFKGKIKENLKFDLVTSFVYTIYADNNEYKKEEKADYDPDMDGILYGRRIYKYAFQSYNVFKSKYTGYGFQIAGRIAKRVNKKFQWVLFEKLCYQTLSDNDFVKSIDLQEIRLASDERYEIYNKINLSSSGDIQIDKRYSITGIGAVMEPLNNLQIGFGAKWYYDFEKIIYDLLNGEVSDFGEYDEEEKMTINRIVFPFGFEYRLSDKFVMRLGVETNIYSEEITSKVQGKDIFYRDQQYLNVSSTNVKSSFNSMVFYGFGYNISDNIHMDFSGRYKYGNGFYPSYYRSYVSLSSFELSVVITF